MAHFDPHDYNARNELERDRNAAKHPVAAPNFMATIAANVDNTKLSDAEFREFIRNTLPIVDYPRPEEKDKEKR